MNGEISLTMTFDAGHRIVGHKGKCARLHGHTYKVHILCQGKVKDPGFVVDFGDIKDLVNEWDHQMLLWIDDPLWGPQGNPNKREQLLGSFGCLCLAFNPTAENMAAYLAKKIVRTFGLISTQVTLWETPNCSATYYWNASYVD